MIEVNSSVKRHWEIVAGHIAAMGKSSLWASCRWANRRYGKIVALGKSSLWADIYIYIKLESRFT